MAKVTCPECESTLNPAKPLTPGKKVKCPRCEAVFVVPENDDDEGMPVSKKAPAHKSASAIKKPSAKPKAPAAPPPPTKTKEEEESEGTYGFRQLDEDKEDENKPKVNYAPDIAVKDPRGPAIKKLAAPSNSLLINGALLFFGGLFSVALGLWPFVFAKYPVAPKEAIKDFRKVEFEAQKTITTWKLTESSFGSLQGDGVPARVINTLRQLTDQEFRAEGAFDVELNKLLTKDEVDRNGSTIKSRRERRANPNARKNLDEYLDDPNEQQLYAQYPGAVPTWLQMCDEKITECTWMLVCGGLAMVYGGVVCYGAVQMQILESYNWSIASSVMVVVVGLGLGFFGIYSIIEDSGWMVQLVTPMLNGVGMGAWALSVLKQESVKEAFEYKAE